MSEAKHTKGPWRVSTKGPLDCLKPTRENCFEVESDDSAYWVAQVLKVFGEGEANAHLIAAAPELLEALTVLYEYEARRSSPDTRYESAMMTRAREAIAKAQGTK